MDKFVDKFGGFMVKENEESKKSFINYISNKQATEQLSMFQRGVLSTLQYAYAEDPENFCIDFVTDSRGRKIKVAREVKIAFAFIKNQMDFNKDKYEKRCETNRKNGSKGGRPKKTETEKSERFFQEPKKPLYDNENDIDNDNIIGDENRAEKMEVKLAEDYHNCLMDAKRNKKNQIMISKDFRLSADDLDFRDAMGLASKKAVREAEKWLKTHFSGMLIGKEFIAKEIVKFEGYINAK